MRDSKNQREFGSTGAKSPAGSEKAVQEVPYDARQFFESFYTANVEGAPKDHMTIGAITEAEAAFHYNAVENSIIRAILRRSPPPAGALVPAWRTALKRQEARLLDVGAGTGHWIDFMRETFFVKQCVGVELTDRMAAYLREKYAGDADITVVQRDVSAPDFGPDALGGAMDYVTAIGVMFHIVDDEKWKQAVGNLSRCLKARGLLLVGEDAGYTTRNKEFHNSDTFATWREFKRAEDVKGEIRVGKRVRSLSDWAAAGQAVGLKIIDVVRADRDPLITTPENDLLVFEKA